MEKDRNIGTNRIKIACIACLPCSEVENLNRNTSEHRNKIEGWKMNQTPAEYRIEELRAKIPVSFGEKLKRYQGELENLISSNKTKIAETPMFQSLPPVNHEEREAEPGNPAARIGSKWIDPSKTEELRNERAAIAEFSGNMTRDEAEKLAFREYPL